MQIMVNKIEADRRYIFFLLFEASVLLPFIFVVTQIIFNMNAYFYHSADTSILFSYPAFLHFSSILCIFSPSSLPTMSSNERQFSLNLPSVAVPSVVCCCPVHSTQHHCSDKLMMAIYWQHLINKCVLSSSECRMNFHFAFDEINVNN